MGAPGPRAGPLDCQRPALRGFSRAQKSRDLGRAKSSSKPLFCRWGNGLREFPAAGCRPSAVHTGQDNTCSSLDPGLFRGLPDLMQDSRPPWEVASPSLTEALGGAGLSVWRAGTQAVFFLRPHCPQQSPDLAFIASCKGVIYSPCTEGETEAQSERPAPFLASLPL